LQLNAMPRLSPQCTPETFMLDANGSVSVVARVDAKGLRRLSVGLATISLSDVLTGVGVGVLGIDTDGLLSIADASLRYVPSIANATGGWAERGAGRSVLGLPRPCGGQQSGPWAVG
jgi:hypothetical protein